MWDDTQTRFHDCTQAIHLDGGFNDSIERKRPENTVSDVVKMNQRNQIHWKLFLQHAIFAQLTAHGDGDNPQVIIIL